MGQFILVLQICTTVFPDNWSPQCPPTKISFPNKISCEARARYFNEKFPIRKHYLDETGDAVFGYNDVALFDEAKCVRVSE